MAEKTYTVTAPNPKFEGVAAGIKFKTGKGKGTRAQVAILVQRGYSCAEVEKAMQTATDKVLSSTTTPSASTPAKTPSKPKAPAKAPRKPKTPQKPKAPAKTEDNKTPGNE